MDTFAMWLGYAVMAAAGVGGAVALWWWVLWGVIVRTKSTHTVFRWAAAEARKKRDRPSEDLSIPGNFW